MLKRFFGRAVTAAPRNGLEEGRFRAASTDWMRHTFARQSLLDGAPLEVVNELMGQRQHRNDVDLLDAGAGSEDWRRTPEAVAIRNVAAGC